VRRPGGDGSGVCVVCTGLGTPRDCHRRDRDWIWIVADADCWTIGPAESYRFTF